MRSQPRAGFTLVELMVAMALTMFLMVILSQAFVIALDTFVGLKAIGDMQTTLRTAKVILTADLSEDHLEGARRLSDLTKNGDARIVRQKPRAGFFAVLHGSAVADANAGNAQTGVYVREGRDPTGFDSFRATNHVLYMTVKRKGNRTENFFTASLPMPAAAAFFNIASPSSYTMNPQTELPVATYGDDPTTGATSCNFNGQWAEVMYYLVQTGSTEEPNNPTSKLGIPLFSLMRAQFVMVTDGTNLTGIGNGALSAFQGVSCNQTGGGNLAFFSPADATSGNRVQPALASLIDPTSSAVAPLPRITSAATLVLPNLTSFHIQIMRIGMVGGLPVNDMTFVDVPISSSGPAVYDTAMFGAVSYSAGATTGLKGIQVTLRVFEAKTRQTRQMTIVQDL